MFNAVLFPLNFLIVFILCAALSIESLSHFYQSPGSDDLIFLFMIICLYAFGSIIMKRKYKPKVEITPSLSMSYAYFLAIAVLGFAAEFVIYGVPILIKGGRDGYTGIPVLHVVFYSCAIISSLMASLYSSAKHIIVALLIAAIISVLTLSRQMMMVSFAIFIISSIIRYKFTAKALALLFLFVAIILASFGAIGNIRQEISGDYVKDYIFLVGGANYEGREIGTSLYWLWIYVATPVYNLLYNLNQFDKFGDVCSIGDVVGTCNGTFSNVVLMPNTIAKYIGEPEFKISLQIPYLNAGTGFSYAARLWGIAGVVVCILMQFVYYAIGYVITPLRLRVAYTVYFSALSIFMIFDNLYTRGEFFFGFVLLITYHLLSKLGVKFTRIIRLRPENPGANHHQLVDTKRP